MAFSPPEPSANDAGGLDAGAPVDAGLPVDAGRPCSGADETIEATLFVTADNQRTVFVNGVEVEGPGPEWYQPSRRTVRLFSSPGRENVLAVEATNLTSQAGLDRGLILSVSAGGQTLISDRRWKQSRTGPGAWDRADVRWRQPGFDDSLWAAAIEQATNGASPWGLVNLVDRQAQWLWAYDSRTANKPNVETVLLRRTFWLEVDGGFSDTPTRCP